MSYSRVTQQLLTNRAISDLQNQTRELIALQRQLSTGQRINAPSDDPIDARRAIDTRTQIQKTTQHVDNIAMATTTLDETSSIVGQIQQAVGRAYELTLQASNDTNTDEQLSYIAEEINQILETVLTNANHQTNDRYIFGGTRTSSKAFEAIRDADGNITSVSYNGNDQKIEVIVSDLSRITINEPGSQVLQGDVDVFEMLIGIRDDMLAADQDSLRDVRMAEIETATEQLARAVSRVGASQNRLEGVETANEDYILSNQTLLSKIADVDYAETYIQISARQNAYQASLQAAAQVIQPTLLDYLY